MGTTSLGFPYPASTDEPNVPVDIQALADAVDAYLAPKFVDTGWLDLVSIASGWTGEPQARQIGNVVYLRGHLNNPTFSSGLTTIAHLPDGIDPPVTFAHQIDASGLAASALRSVRVNGDGTVAATSTSATIADLYFSSSYLTD